MSASIRYPTSLGKGKVALWLLVLGTFLMLAHVLLGEKVPRRKPSFQRKPKGQTALLTGTEKSARDKGSFKYWLKPTTSLCKGSTHQPGTTECDFEVISSLG